jgi:hypothetical protein
VGADGEVGIMRRKLEDDGARGAGLGQYKVSGGIRLARFLSA